MMTCAICGKENPAGVEYCEDCGAALIATAATPAAAGEGSARGQAGAAAPASGQGQAGTAASVSEPPFTPEGEAVTASPEVIVATPEGEPPAQPSPIVNPRLVSKRYGAVTAEEIPLQGDHLVVGRFDPETGPVDIDLSGSPEAVQLSRHHAELYREADGGWYVKDLGSTNGVFVKRPGSDTFGPRLTTPTALMPGDEVAFGNARFIFKAD